MQWAKGLDVGKGNGGGGGGGGGWLDEKRNDDAYINTVNTEIQL